MILYLLIFNEVRRYLNNGYFILRKDYHGLLSV